MIWVYSTRLKDMHVFDAQEYQNTYTAERGKIKDLLSNA